MSRGGEEELTSYRFGNGKKKKFPGSGLFFSLPAVCWLPAVLLKKKGSFPVDSCTFNPIIPDCVSAWYMVGSSIPPIVLPCHSDNVDLIRNVPKCLDIKYWNPVWESREIPRSVTDDCMGCYPQHWRKMYLRHRLALLVL